MDAQDTSAVVLSSVIFFIWASALGICVWRANRRAPAGRDRENLPGLDGAVELGNFANGTANGTITARARDTAHDSTHAAADDTATSAASGNANGAASEPH